MRLRATAVTFAVLLAFAGGVAVGTWVVAPRLGPGYGLMTGAEASTPPATGNASPSHASPRPAGSGPPSRAPGSPVPSSSLPPAKPGEVPILYYHRVAPEPPGWASMSLDARRAFLSYDVLPIAFNAQLDWLAANGYHTILPRDLAAHWDKGRPLPPRPIILTFDDGTHDWVTDVLPALQRHHMVAEFYVVIENVGNALSWADVRQLAHAGMGIGAHDVHHVQLAGFGGNGLPASPATMRAEVEGARQAIEQNAGVVPDSMAYVGGGFDATLEQIVQQAGYTTARTILRGVIQSPDKRYELRVSRIGAYDDVRDALGSPRLVPGLPTFVKRVTGVDPG